MRHAAVALAALILLGGLYVGLRAGDTAALRPTIVAPCVTDTPGVLCGSASMNGAIVRVELRNSEGALIAEDEIMDGEENIFEFLLENDELHGQDLTIVAIAQDGTSTSQGVHVN